MAVDMIFNSQGSGDVANKLLATNLDVGIMRPYVEEDGCTYITVNQGGKPTPVRIGLPFHQQYGHLIGNTPANQLAGSAGATLRKQEWIAFDEAVIRAARPRLKAAADLQGANSFTVPDGMGVTVLQHQTITDVGSATISMDGMRKGERDRPTYDLRNLPLPIIHADFSFPLREILVSRRMGTPLDTTMAEMAGRRCAEELENLVLGTTSYSYGGGTIYGYTNFPDRIVASMTIPTAVGWAAGKTVDEVLGLIATAQTHNFFGPFLVYHSPSWARYLDSDYNQYQGQTLRDRIAQIAGIAGVPRQLDYLTGYQMLLIQMTPDVARMVVGMEFRTIQWQEAGGYELFFKVIGIKVPQLRSDANANTGIIHATAS